jgi:hypothetical protein
MAKRFDPHVAKALLAPHLAKLRTASYAELGRRREAVASKLSKPQTNRAVYQMEALFVGTVRRGEMFESSALSSRTSTEKSMGHRMDDLSVSDS